MGISNKANKGINIVLSTLVIYGTAWLGIRAAHEIARSRSERIKKGSHLEQVVTEEKENKGIPSVHINQSIQYLEKRDTASYVQKTAAGYDWVFDKYEGNTRLHVRHELCHIL